MDNHVRLDPSRMHFKFSIPEDCAIARTTWVIARSIASKTNRPEAIESGSMLVSVSDLA